MNPPVSTALDLLLDATLAASILFVLVALVQLALGKRLGPAWRFLLWTPILLRLLIPIFPESSFSLFNAVRWIQELRQTPAAPPPPIDFNSFSEPVLFATGEAPEPAPAALPAGDWKERVATLAAYAWLTVALLLLLRLLLGSTWLTWRLRRASTPRAGHLAEILGQAAAELGLRNLPRFRETSLVESPALFGLARPTLLLPLDFAQRLTPAEVRHVFLHELAHLKRRDLPLNWLMSIAQAIHWFNPLVWLAFRQMRIERELACDSMALRAATSEDPQAYGRTILHLLEGVTSRTRMAALVGIAEEKHSAKRRLQQIASFTPGHRRYWLALPILLIVTIAGLTNAQNPQPEEPKDESVQAAQTSLSNRLSKVTIDRVSIHNKSLADAVEALEKKLPADLQDLQFKFLFRTNIASGANGTFSVNARGFIQSPVNSKESPANHIRLASIPESETEPATEKVSVLEILDHIKQTAEEPLDYQITEEAVIFFEPDTQPNHAQLFNDARLLMEMEKFDDAETKLRQVLEVDEDNQAAAYYLALIRERRYAEYARRRGQPYDPNGAAATSTSTSPNSRAAVTRKLETVIIPELHIEKPGYLGPLLEKITELSRRHDPEGTGVNLLVQDQPLYRDPASGDPRLLNFVVQLESPLRDKPLWEVISRVASAARPPTGEANIRVVYSIEKHGVAFAEQPLDEIRPRRTIDIVAPAAQLINDARLLMEMGKLDEAEEKLRQVLERDPENRSSKYYLALIDERRNSFQGRDRDRAARLQGQFLANFPQEPLYTRTFRLDTNTFLPDLQQTVLQQTVGPIATYSSDQEAASLNGFSGFGPEAPLGTEALSKVLLYNEHTGVLFARATLADLARVEKALQDYMLPPREVQSRSRSTNASLLVNDARLLMEVGKLDEAKEKLRQAIEQDPEHRAAHYYLEIIAKRNSPEARERESMAKEQMIQLEQSWNMPLAQAKLPLANPFASTNHVHRSTQREAIAKKLEEIVLPRFHIPGDLPLSEVVKSLDHEATKRDPQNRGINFIISSILNKTGPLPPGQLAPEDFRPAVDPLTGQPPVKTALRRPVIVEDFLVKIDPPLLNVRLIDVLNAIVLAARPPAGSDPAERIQYSVEDYAVVLFAKLKKSQEPLYTRTFRLDPDSFLQSIEGVTGPTEKGQPDSRQEQTRNGILGQTLSVSEMNNVQTAIQKFFAAAGVDFGPRAMGETPPFPQKAIFFNDRTGTLFVRATAKELDTVEAALQALNLPPANPEREREALHVRTYRLDPGALLSNLEKKIGPIANIPPGFAPTSLQAAVQKVFADAGVTFPPMNQSPVLESNQRPLTPPKKSISYNDNTGVLFVRATLADLDIVEKTLQALNAPPLQVTLVSRVVSFAAPADASAFLDFLQQEFGQLRTVFNAGETQAILEYVKKTPSAQVLAAPRVTTLSGRAARVSVEADREALVIDIHPEFRPNRNLQASCLRLP